MPKLSLIAIPLVQLKPLITLAFQDDDELLRRYTPVKDDTLENCVNRCHDTIVDMFTSKVYAESERRIYKVEFDDEGVKKIIGYTVVAINTDAPNELFSFGINCHYRSKQIVLKWLKEVQFRLGKFFWIALYKENERAINFFVKNGFTKQAEEDKSFVMLLGNHQEYIATIKHKSICQ